MFLPPLRWCGFERSVKLLMYVPYFTLRFRRNRFVSCFIQRLAAAATAVRYNKNRTLVGILQSVLTYKAKPYRTNEAHYHLPFLLYVLFCYFLQAAQETVLSLTDTQVLRGAYRKQTT